jgi:hypothetical protein
LGLTYLQLLVYHYLVAEYFMTSSHEPDEFFANSKRVQADYIWQVGR